ncbi:hypothetical protein JTE90_011007 [Oedothorax gibbosus]|uniref:Uncharacterized protein n=1 Tax=Oedothorax gibbosus TaxID=931172 RepID=A0AAV6VEE5_9ARAC|nr:hypothetical protein JTE90_011007 [Oedothorax gibbosus]
MDNLKNKHVEVAALLEGIVTEIAYIVDAEKGNNCSSNLKTQSGEDRGVTLDVSEKEKTVSDIKKAAEVHANELSDDEEYLNSPPVEPIVNPSQMQFQFSASNIELTGNVAQTESVMDAEQGDQSMDNLKNIHGEIAAFLEVPNETAQNSADEISQGGSKRLLKESLFLPYHEENNAGVHNFNSNTLKILSVNDENETKHCNNKIHHECAGMNSGYVQFLSYKNNQTAATGKAEVEEKQSSKIIKKALTRYSLMKTLKDEIEQKKQASFDRHKIIEEADEEIYDGKDKEMSDIEHGEIYDGKDKELSDIEDGEIYEGEADDEEDCDRDGFCPEEKLFPDPSNSGNSQSRPFHQWAVPSSSCVQPVIIQGSQPFPSQDIQMICSGQFSHEENQLSAWSPNSQRKIETDEADDDVTFIAEKRQSFKVNAAIKRKLGSSPSTMNKKLKKDKLSSCSSSGEWEETFPTNHEDSSDGEAITPGAKKCKVLNYSSEDDDEGNESVINDKEKNINRQVAMKSPCNFISANEDSKYWTYQEKSESSEDNLDGDDVLVNEPIIIADDMDKNFIPKAMESPGVSISANANKNSLNPMELSLQVNDRNTVLQKPKKINEFLELEAELDSNEEASSDESESEVPEDLKDDLFDDVPVNEENPQELAIIHHKYLCEDDAQVVKQLQEQYLPGGELHEEGKGRQKKFLWNNNDSSAAPNETLMSDSDQEEVAEISISQEKAIWRQKATVVHGSDEESDGVDLNKKSTKHLPVNIVGKVNTSQVIDKPYVKASPSSTVLKVRRSGSLIGVNGSNKLSLQKSKTEQKTTVLFKAMQDAQQQDGI